MLLQISTDNLMLTFKDNVPVVSGLGWAENLTSEVPFLTGTIRTLNVLLLCVECVM